jgi:hypothetical protein
MAILGRNMLYCVYVCIIIIKLVLTDFHLYTYLFNILRTGRQGDRGSIPGRGERTFPLTSVSRLALAYPASCTMGTGGPFPGGKERPGSDGDHSPPSSAEVVNE